MSTIGLRALNLQQLCIIELAKHFNDLSPSNYHNFIHIISTYWGNKELIRDVVLKYLKSQVCENCENSYVYIYNRYKQYPTTLTCYQLITHYSKNNIELIDCIRCVNNCKKCSIKII